VRKLAEIDIEVDEVLAVALDIRRS
jgi:hypothetical protein